MPVRKYKQPAKKRARSKKSLPSPSRRELSLLLVAAVLLLAGVWLVKPWRAIGDVVGAPRDGRLNALARSVKADFDRSQKALAQFQDEETKSGITVVPDADIAAQVAAISLDMRLHNYKKAQEGLKDLKDHTASWNKQLEQQRRHGGVVASASRTAPSASPSAAHYLNVPILMYHETPGDFDNQLAAIEAKGYTVVDMGQLTEALAHRATLPAKSVVITFDDGFASQMQAFASLQKHNMKATFYIIDGGPESTWCIGAGRRYNDPSQPADGCGDSYLSWDQVRQLDQSGLITIGAHTINHRNLAALSQDQQEYEIREGKMELEQQLGHPVYDLAYPYGGFNALSVNLARQAGFRSAVTTLPGTYQAMNAPYTLNRIRSAYALP